MSGQQQEHPIISAQKPGRNWRTFLGVLLLVAVSINGAVAIVQGNSLPPMPLAYAYVPSPNCDDRPASAEITCIVIHSTVEPTTEGTEGIFLNAAKKVSAHFVVGKDGRVVQMVPVEKRAWHAGKSMLDGVSDVNSYSIGIEMVNLNDGVDPYPPAQVEAVAGLIRLIRSRYNVPDNRVVSHAQIAQPAGRKSDPVGFDFEALLKLARTPETSTSVPTGSRPTPTTVPMPAGRHEREE